MRTAKGVVAVGIMAMMGAFSGARFGDGDYLFSLIDLAAAGYWGAFAYANLKEQP